MSANEQQQKLFIGEGFEGPGVNLAHINVLVGPRNGPAGQAFATALATPSAGHAPFVVIARPGVPTKPLTLYVNKAQIGRRVPRQRHVGRVAGRDRESGRRVAGGRHAAARSGERVGGRVGELGQSEDRRSRRRLSRTTTARRKTPSRPRCSACRNGTKCSPPRATYRIRSTRPTNALRRAPRQSALLVRYRCVRPRRHAQWNTFASATRA